MGGPAGDPHSGVERMTGHHCLRMREIILKNNRKWMLVRQPAQQNNIKSTLTLI